MVKCQTFKFLSLFRKKILLFLLSEVKRKQKFLYREYLIISLEITLFRNGVAGRENLSVSQWLERPSNIKKVMGWSQSCQGLFFCPTLVTNELFMCIIRLICLHSHKQTGRQTNYYTHHFFPSFSSPALKKPLWPSFPFFQFTGCCS